MVKRVFAIMCVNISEMVRMMIVTIRGWCVKSYPNLYKHIVDQLARVKQSVGGESDAHIV